MVGRWVLFLGTTGTGDGEQGAGEAAATAIDQFHPHPLPEHTCQESAHSLTHPRAIHRIPLSIPPSSV